VQTVTAHRVHPPVNGAVRNENSPLLEIAAQAARAAGEIIREGWGQPHRVVLKGVTNPVTEIDHAAEDQILTTLQAATPDFGVLSEESPERPGSRGERWVIDPLDGTSNYTHHFPYFAVSIALEREGQPEIGVVYDPILNQMFVAERGRGASLNGNRIRVGTRETLADSMIAAGFPYDVWETGRNLEEIVRLTRRAQTVRINGSAALDMAYVACGRLDAYWDSGLYAWDIAAGRLLVEEAGGLLTLHGGDPDIVESQVMIASNPRLQPLIKSIVLAE
jgi:myo-inositol-1(or 4)-monophosphatase